MAANGVVGQSDVSEGRRAFEDPSFLYRGGLVVSVWGASAAPMQGGSQVMQVRRRLEAVRSVSR